MKKVAFKNKSYEVDSRGFLIDAGKWDRNFAEGMSETLGMQGGLSSEQWRVIEFIRDFFKEKGECPVIYETCRKTGLFIKDFKELFPTGYLRGACKLAGITYEDRMVNFFGEESARGDLRAVAKEKGKDEKTYRVDVNGFLVDPREWDENFADTRARELMIKEGLTERHMQIIRYMRESRMKNGEVPTFYETCEANKIDLEGLERLFPTGYHRGAVKIAGLRVK